MTSFVNPKNISTNNSLANAKNESMSETKGQLSFIQEEDLRLEEDLR